MTGKTKNYLKWIPSLLIALFMTLGAIMNFIGTPQLVKLYSKIGLQNSMLLFGITELLFISLFLWPRTMKIGFFLPTGYYGGAMAVELSAGTVFIFPALILTIVWIAAYLRDSTLFKSRQRESFA